jgi:hypothetical protein
MKSRIAVVIIAGSSAVFFGWMSLVSWHTYQTYGNQFIVTSISHVRGTTTLLRVIECGAVALFCSLIFVGGIFVLFSRRDVEQLESPDGETAQAEVVAGLDAVPPWTCPACHEENPGNFDECCKCQRNRPLKSPS